MTWIVDDEEVEVQTTDAAEYRHVAGTERSIDPSKLKTFPTPCLIMDLGFGGVSAEKRLGLAYGGWVTLSAASGMYKTGLGLEIIATAKRWAEQIGDTEVLANVIDFERTGVNEVYAERMGTLNNNHFTVQREVDAKYKAFEDYVYSFIHTCEKAGKRGVLLIDSITSVVGNKEYENMDSEKGSYGWEAYGLFDKNASKLQDACARAEVTLIFIAHDKWNPVKMKMPNSHAKERIERLPTKLLFFRNHGMFIEKKYPLYNRHGELTGNVLRIALTKTRTNREKIVIPVVERTHYGVDDAATNIAWLAQQKAYRGHDSLINLFSNQGRYPLGVNVKSSITKEGADEWLRGSEIWNVLTDRQVSNPTDETLLEIFTELRKETMRVWFEKEEQIAQENGVGLKPLLPLSLDQDYD